MYASSLMVDRTTTTKMAPCLRSTLHMDGPPMRSSSRVPLGVSMYRVLLKCKACTQMRRPCPHHHARQHAARSCIQTASKVVCAMPSIGLGPGTGARGSITLRSWLHQACTVRQARRAPHVAESVRDGTRRIGVGQRRQPSTTRGGVGTQAQKNIVFLVWTTVSTTPKTHYDLSPRRSDVVASQHLRTRATIERGTHPFVSIERCLEATHLATTLAASTSRSSRSFSRRKSHIPCLLLEAAATWP